PDVPDQDLQHLPNDRRFVERFRACPDTAGIALTGPRLGRPRNYRRGHRLDPRGRAGPKPMRDPRRGEWTKTGPPGHEEDQRSLDRLRAGVILRAHVEGWPAIDLGAITVEAG